MVTRRRRSGRASRACWCRAAARAATPGRTPAASTSRTRPTRWVKDVQVDGTTVGDAHPPGGHLPLRRPRQPLPQLVQLRLRRRTTTASCSRCGAADNLVENNVARFMNKPILFNNSGGGNVVGYNYADNSWSCDGNNDDGFQEVNIDCHCAFPHMELMEGNWAPHMGATTTHGNAGYLTYFRNYASSQWSPSMAGQPQSAIVWSQPFAPQYANVGTLDFAQPRSQDDRHRQRPRQHRRREPRPAGRSRHDEHRAREPGGDLAGLHVRRAAASSRSSWSIRRPSRGRASG